MKALNRLMLWQKFVLLGCIGLLLAALPLGLFIHEAGKTVSAATRGAEGLAPARAVLSVVTLMQQHRGMSSVFLNGNEGMASQRAAKQQEVEAAFKAADSAIATTADNEIVQAWASAHNSWASLPQKVATRTINAPASFAEHTALINELLKVKEKIINRSGLALDSGPATHYLIEAALLQSPQLTETLGRLRARGSGILTAGSASPADRAAVIALQSRAEDLYAGMEKSFALAAAADPALKALFDAPLRQSLDVGRATLDITQNKVVLAEDLKHPPAEYFAKTTEAITVQLKLYDLATVELERLLNERRQTARNDILLTLAEVLVLAALAVALGLLITRSITVPLNQAIAVARRIAEGDLSQRILADSANETGRLLQALGEMNNSLGRIVSEVRAGTRAIEGASAEIAAANMDLSARTEAQAGALEETASSMEELTGTVQQNAGSASQANELARNASRVAERGGEMVTQVVETMGSIDASSRKVADIISVINGIAFQTNILALNAAVEAARAGEQGRGFAVVASEVRSLAQRSASAAKEIEALIKDSVERAAAGAKLAGQTGATMNEIVESIRQVTVLVKEIAEASDQQSSGIGQVNQAVSEMDSTTQQNASLVEQAAAAAEALKEQAASLAQLVSVFRLEAGFAPSQDAGHGSGARLALPATGKR